MRNICPTRKMVANAIGLRERLYSVSLSSLQPVSHRTEVCAHQIFVTPLAMPRRKIAAGTGIDMISSFWDLAMTLTFDKIIECKLMAMIG